MTRAETGNFCFGLICNSYTTMYLVSHKPDIVPDFIVIVFNCHDKPVNL